VYACCNGRTDVVKLLLDNNCDVLDNDGFSGALHVACLEGFVDIVDLLLRNNCNINQCNTSHDTPIVCACRTSENPSLSKTSQLLSISSLTTSVQPLRQAHTIGVA
jgi:ankyrin repeat protein